MRRCKELRAGCGNKNARAALAGGRISKCLNFIPHPTELVKKNRRCVRPARVARDVRASLAKQLHGIRCHGNTKHQIEAKPDRRTRRRFDLGWADLRGGARADAGNPEHAGGQRRVQQRSGDGHGRLGRGVSVVRRRSGRPGRGDGECYVHRRRARNRRACAYCLAAGAASLSMTGGKGGNRHRNMPFPWGSL